MGNLGAYPPFLAAWGPFLLFLLVGEAVLIRTRNERGRRSRRHPRRGRARRRARRPVADGGADRGAGAAALHLAVRARRPTASMSFCGARSASPPTSSICRCRSRCSGSCRPRTRKAAHGAVKLALLIALVPSSLIALVVTLNAARRSPRSSRPRPRMRPPAAGGRLVRLGAALVDVRRGRHLGRPRPARLRPRDTPAHLLGADRAHRLRTRLLRCSAPARSG